MADSVFRIEVGAKIGTSTDLLKKDIEGILSDLSTKRTFNIEIGAKLSSGIKADLQKQLAELSKGLKVEIGGTAGSTGKNVASPNVASTKLLSPVIKAVNAETNAATKSAIDFQKTWEAATKVSAVGLMSADKQLRQIIASSKKLTALDVKDVLSRRAADKQTENAQAAAAEMHYEAEATAYLKAEEVKRRVERANTYQSFLDEQSKYEAQQRQWNADTISLDAQVAAENRKQQAKIDLSNAKAAEAAKKAESSLQNALSSSNPKALEYKKQLKEIRALYDDGFASGQDYKKLVSDLGAEAKRSGALAETAGERFSRMFNTKVGYAVVAAAMYAIRNAVRDIYNNVVELDTAMTELKKVTNETDETYRSFLNNAADRAQNLGATLTDTVNATADFARLGYSLDDSSELADAALVYKNVGDGIENISAASQSVIATMQAFGISASDAMGIVDKFNEVGNNYAISSKGIGDALLRSAAAMHSANNTLDETIALATAANTVVQDPEKVGTVLKTLSMYLRAAKTEAEEAGESTDGMADSVSKLREEILSLTGQKVDIMLDEDTFKSSYQILKEISQVWNQLTDVSQANLLEMLGGKRNSNVVAALVENFSVAEKVLKTSQGAAGSALAENEKVLDSISGKLSILSATWQELSNSLLDNQIIKSVIDLLTSLLQALNDLNTATNGWSSGIIALGAAFVIVNGVVSVFQSNIGHLGDIISAFGSGFGKISGALKSIVGLFSTTSAATSAVGSAFAGLSTATLVWIGIAVTAVGIVYRLYKSFKDAHPSIEQLTQDFKAAQAAVDELQNQLDTNSSRIEELQKLAKDGSINLVEQEELDRLSQENQLLEGQLAVKEKLRDIEKGELENEANKQARAFFAETSGITEDAWGVKTDNRSQAEKIEDSMAAYNNAKQALESEIQKGANADQKRIDSIRASMANLEKSMYSEAASMDSFLPHLDPNGELAQEANLLYVKLDLLTGGADGVQKAWERISNIPAFSEAIRQLQGLSKNGNLTAETLAEQTDPSVQSFLNTLEELGLFSWDNADGLVNQLDSLGTSAVDSSEKIDTLLASLETITSKYDALQAAQKEYAKSGRLSYDTLSSIATATKYPDLANSIDLYIAGLKTEKQLLAEMSAVYNLDVTNYKKSIAAKLASSPDFYNQLSSKQKTYINDLSKSYGIDLSNFKTLEQKKLEFQAQIIMKLAANYSRYAGASMDTLYRAQERLILQQSRATSPNEKSALSQELASVTDTIQAVLGYQNALNKLTLEGVSFEPANYSSSDSSASSASTDKYKEAVEAQITVLKHRLAVEEITQAQYYDALESIELKYYKDSTAHQNKYAAEIRSIDEELFNGRREIFDDWINDQQKKLESMNNAGDIEGQKNLYNELLSAIEHQIDSAHKYGLDENSDYIQELRDQYKGLCDDIVSMMKDAFAEYESYLDDFDLWDDVGFTKTDYYDQWIFNLKSMYEDGLIAWADYVNEYNEIASKRYDSQKSSMEDIIDLTMEMIEQEAQDQVDALEKQKEAYADIIALKKELLQDTADEKNHEQEVADAVSEIAKLQSKIAQLSLDDSRSAAAQRAQLEEQLAEKQKDLADLQSDYALDQTLDVLDKQQEAFEDEKDAEADAVNDSVKSWQKRYEMAIDRINNDWDGLYKDLKKYSYEHRDSIDGPDSLESAWGEATKALQQYGDALSVINNSDFNYGLNPDVSGSADGSSILKQMQANSAYGLLHPGSGLNSKNQALAEQYYQATGRRLYYNSSVGWVFDNKNSTNAAYEIEGEIAQSNPYAPGQSSKGQTSEAVKWAQYQLRGAGFNQPVDGTFWTTTEANVLEFQRRHNLSKTGKVDAATLRYLKAYHTGGVVDSEGSINDKEVLAILQRGELVLDEHKKAALKNMIGGLKTLAGSLASGNLSAKIMGIRNTPIQSANTYAPHIEVNIQSNGKMTDAEARHYGKVVANTALDELKDAFTKRGL